MAKFNAVTVLFATFLFVSTTQADEFPEGGLIPEELRHIAKKLHNLCQKETEVEENLIKEAIHGNFVEDPKLKCYIHCLYRSAGCVADDGTFDIDAGLALIQDEKLREEISKIAYKCGTVVGADLCDTFYHTSKCHFKYLKEDYWMI